MQSEKKKVYNPTIDLLRIIAILAVVLIHTSTKTLMNSSLHLPWTLLLNQSSRFAVPMFFLISGFVLELSYNSHNNYVTYLKKRANRIFIPYIFWSALYFFLWYHHPDVSQFVQALVYGDASYQLYFIPSLLIFYILFPVLHRYYRFISHPIILILLLLSQLGILYYQFYLSPMKFFHPAAIALLNYAVFILGMVASHYQEQLLSFINKWKIEITLATLMLLFYVYFEGKVFAQWRPSTFLYTIFLTATLYSFLTTRITSVRFIQLLSKLSFFVFFIHIFILEISWNFLFYPLLQITPRVATEHGWFDIFFFILVAGISFGSAYMIHKIPRVSIITG